MSEVKTDHHLRQMKPLDLVWLCLLRQNPSRAGEAGKLFRERAAAGAMADPELFKDCLSPHIRRSG